MPTLNFVVPGKHTKGYLRRQMRAMEFSLKLRDKDTDPSLFKEMAKFLAPMLVLDEPDLDKAADFLLDELTQEQYEQMLAALTGGAANTIPPPIPTPSESSTSQA